MKKTYFVTERAGRDVAGVANPGVDQPIPLTDGQAEHPLRLGHVRIPTDHDGNGKAGGTKKPSTK